MQSILATNFIQDAFSPLIAVFKAIMVFLHNNVTGGSWGLAIIGLTIIVRAALVPLTVKQFSSMAKLQALGPEIKALQAKYKDDKQRLNEETMKFYRENKVNPFGSCLPLVLQLPVFLSLFYMLRSDLKLQICGPALAKAGIHGGSALQNASCQTYAHGSGKFLFIPDVTASAHGGVLIILIVLYIGSQLVSSIMTTATVDRNQRLIALGLPFVFTIFILGFPAGLILYWITTNLWTVGQQYIVRRYFPPPHLTGAGADAGKLSLAGLFTRSDAEIARKAGDATKGGAPRPAAKANGGKRAAAAKPTPRKEAANKAEPVPTGRRKGGAATATAATEKGATKAQQTRVATKPAAGKGPAKTAAGKGPAKTVAGKAPATGRGATRTAPAAADGAGDKPVAAPRPRGSAPPPPPRKKKKRSGRRR